MAKRRERKALAPRGSEPHAELSLLTYLTNYRQMNLLLGRTQVKATVERVEEV